MERMKYSGMICATLWLYLVFAAALQCCAGRVFPTNGGASCVADSCNALNAGRTSARDSTAAMDRWAEKAGGNIFVMDYSFNPGSPRPVPQAPRGRAPRIGLPPSPSINGTVPAPRPLPPPPLPLH